MDINPHVPQVSKLSFDLGIGVLSCRARQQPVQSRKTCKFTAESWTIMHVPLAHRPPPKTLMDSIKPVDLTRPPAEEVAEEQIGGLSGVLSTEGSLEREPVVLVKVLLLPVRQAHEQPVLDLLAFGEGLTRRV